MPRPWWHHGVAGIPALKEGETCKDPQRHAGLQRPRSAGMDGGTAALVHQSRPSSSSSQTPLERCVQGCGESVYFTCELVDLDTTRVKEKIRSDMGSLSGWVVTSLIVTFDYTRKYPPPKLELSSGGRALCGTGFLVG